MAIKRCPYCKAIIDEEDKYCNNCGTQLLFPEDESIEEEIPGEKLTHEDVDREEEESLDEETEFEEIEEPPEDRDDSSAFLEETEESGKETGDAGGEIEKKSTESGILSDEGEEEEMGDILESARESPESAEAGLKEGTSPEEEKTTPTPGAAGDSADVPDFKTRDLEKMVHPAGAEEEEIEKLLAFLDKGKKAGKKRPSKQKALFPPETADETTSKTGELPPWARKIKESPSSDIQDTEKRKEEEEEEEGLKEELVTGPADETYEEETEEEEIEEATGKTWQPSPESGIGIPEGVDQKTLPLSVPTEGEAMEEELEEETVKPPSKFLLKIKAVAFDLFFIAVLWFVSVYLASRLMEVSVFRLFSASPSSLLVFLGVLLVFYFFLFLFFLGETLGGRLFSLRRSD